MSILQYRVIKWTIKIYRSFDVVDHLFPLIMFVIAFGLVVVLFRAGK